jgi:predicted nucleic acid-binding protein
VEYALVDTGIWYGVFDNRDQWYQEAASKAEYFDYFKLVIPWPTLYETLRTSFVKNDRVLQRFESFLKSSNALFLDDANYRDKAFELSLDSSLRRGRPLSMVDCLLRLVIDDPNVKIDYLLTFNPRDFIDACRKNRVEIL